jgi:hypothetical protein
MYVSEEPIRGGIHLIFPGDDSEPVDIVETLPARKNESHVRAFRPRQWVQPAEHNVKK